MRPQVRDRRKGRGRWTRLIHDQDEVAFDMRGRVRGCDDGPDAGRPAADVDRDRAALRDHEKIPVVYRCRCHFSGRHPEDRVRARVRIVCRGAISYVSGSTSAETWRDESRALDPDIAPVRDP